MKIAVIYPEVLDMARYRDKRKEFPPFGALYIAASLEKEGYEVTIFKLHPTKLVFDFSEYESIAFSISSSATFNMFMECRFKSKFHDNVLLMAGGVHANLFPEQTLKDLKVDVVGIGEGEQTIIDILNVKDTKDFFNIPGVCYMKNSELIKTSSRKISRNIDHFPLPARNLLNPSDFIMGDRMSNTDVLMTHIMPGRGCPFPCRFCASAQTSVQYRSGEDIRRELKHLIKHYGIKGFAVVGNDFILNKNNVKEICNSIGDLNLSWATLSRVDRVDPELLKLMKDAGCYELEFGVEAGSIKILEAMQKKTTIDQIINGIRMTYEAGIKVKVFLIHGFPGENYDTTMETIDLLEKVGKWIERVSLFRFVPLPGTHVHNFPKLYNLRGTYGSDEWDGNWGKFHIHHNNHHWWGSEDDFKELNRSFKVLFDYVEERWSSKFSLDDLAEDKWQLQSNQFIKTKI